MSSEYEEERQDPRPFAMRQSVQTLEHMTNIPDDSKQLQRIYAVYSELGDPNLHYTNIPDEKQMMSTKVRMRNVIDLRYGSGKRRHTLSDLADKHFAYTVADLKLNRGLKGFERIQANTTSINTRNTTIEERKKRGGHWYNPASWGK